MVSSNGTLFIAMTMHKLNITMSMHKLNIIMPVTLPCRRTLAMTSIGSTFILLIIDMLMTNMQCFLTNMQRTLTSIQSTLTSI